MDEVLGKCSRPFRLSATRQDRDPVRAQRRVWRFMASNIKATSQKEEVPENEAPETVPDSSLLDLSDAAGQEAHPLRQEARLRHP